MPAGPGGGAPSGPASPGSVIVLGANGRLGHMCVDAFHSAGWRVAAFARSQPTSKPIKDVAYIHGDALDPDALARAVAGYSVIVNAVNAPYGGWGKMTPQLTQAVVSAATKTAATVIVPGNIYHYGAGMPVLLDEFTPAEPTTSLGRIRLTMERTLQVRSAAGDFQSIIVRAGDFLDGRPTGGWFDGQIAARLNQGKVVYPGPLDVLHAWAFLPDLARAIVAIAATRSRLPPHFALGFPGHVMTGRQLVTELTAIVGRRLRVESLPWPLVRFAGLFSANIRGVAEMAYLWRTPHAIDPSAFDALVPGFEHTHLGQAVREACAQLSAANSKTQ